VTVELFGWQIQIDSIVPGKLVDVAAVPGNPLENISALACVHSVMKGGAVYNGLRSRRDGDSPLPVFYSTCWRFSAIRTTFTRTALGHIK
jgi:hypothetical protein